MGPLVVGDLGRPAKPHAPRLSGRPPSTRPLKDQAALELRDAGEHREHHLARRRSGVGPRLSQRPQARAAFEAFPHDIACFIAEPIQGEGGDNHLRAEFLSAMQRMCHEYDALFVLDEVQTGVGLTGTPWCYQQLGLEPDIVAFAKKLQVGGIMAGRRVDLVPDNVFAVSSRINSTWGGGLTDMVRSRRLLEIIEAEGLFDAAARNGEVLLASLQLIGRKHPGVVSNVRGRGLMCAIDLVDGPSRDRVITELREEGVLALPCGTQSVRFRPALSVTEDELQVGIDALDRVVSRIGAPMRDRESA